MKTGDTVRAKLTGRLGTIVKTSPCDGWIMCTVEYLERASRDVGIICSLDDLEPP